MNDRMMKTAADEVAIQFNNSELQLQSEKQDAVNFMLYESNEEPLSLVKKIGTNPQMKQIKNCSRKGRRNSYYYMKKLVVGLMLIDYSLVDRKSIKEG